MLNSLHVLKYVRAECITQHNVHCAQCIAINYHIFMLFLCFPLVQEFMATVTLQTLESISITAGTERGSERERARFALQGTITAVISLEFSWSPKWMSGGVCHGLGTSGRWCHKQKETYWSERISEGERENERESERASLELEHKVTGQPKRAHSQINKAIVNLNSLLCL